MKKKSFVLIRLPLLYACCLLFGILTLFLLLTRCTPQTKAQGDTFPVWYEDRVIAVEKAEYIATCALLAAGGDVDETAFLQALCVAVHTDAWYLLQRMDALPANAFGVNWATRKDVEARFGEKTYDKWYKVSNDIQNVVLLYAGEPILAAFYPGGFGISESAYAVWGKELSYLSYVRNADMGNMVTRYTFSDLQLQESLGFSPFPKGFRILSRGESARVIQIQCGEQVINGKQISECLGLCSEIFSVTVEKDKTCFTCFGVGESVGMSLAGARVLAANGKDAKEILAQYYPGARWQELTAVT